MTLVARGVTDSSSSSASTESRAAVVYIVTAIITLSSLIVFALRLFIRCVLLKTVGPDDWTMLVAQIFAVVAGISTFIEANNGLGRHVETLSESQLQTFLKCLYVDILSYHVGLHVVKISFLLQYRRIFPSTRLRRICLWLLITVSIWTVISTVLLTMSCVPLANLVPSAASFCLNALPVWESTSIVSLLTDFAIFFLPMPCIWKLPIPSRQKSVLFGIFGLGFFVCIVSIVRVPTLRAASQAQDPTWDNVAAALWTLAELNAAILCSSLPTLRPLFFKSSSSSSAGAGAAAAVGSYGPGGKRSGLNGTMELHGGQHYSENGRTGLHTMRKCPSSEMEEGQGAPLGPGDSSEDLVTATFDEMIYGARTRQSSMGTAGGQLRPVRSTKTMRDMDADTVVELGLTPRPHAM